MSQPPEIDEAAPLVSGERHGVLLRVAYEGRIFSGFARQSNARTIQGELEGALRAIDPRVSQARAASRTDRGVHAYDQVVAFDSAKFITTRKWVLGISHHLPREIAIVSAARVPPGFDPRREARQKTYRYSVLRSRVRDPFLDGRAWRVGDRLNQELMASEASALLGEHDFAAFRSAADERVETVRRILRTELRSERDNRLLTLEIEGNRFLYNMVRIIVGTLIDVGRGKLEPGAVKRALASKRREDLGMTAPPDGLCLTQVVMSNDGEERWPAD